MTFFRRRRKDADLEAEIQAHLAIAVEERVERGESRAEATASARREFGNVALVQEVTRSMWGWSRLERIVDGVRHAVRYNLATFRREPVSCVVMVLTLALILGGNITMFSSTNAAILRNRPGARHTERLVDFVHAVPDRMSEAGEFSQRAYLDYRERLTTLAGLAAYSTFDRTTLRTSDGAVDAARTASVSGNYFAVLEVTPAAGRFFTLDDDRKTAEPTAVIAYRIWQERFAGAPSAIGSSIMVNGRPFTVIGVAPKDFLGTSVWRDDIWIPLARDEKAEVYRVAASDWLGLVGRLEPGVSVETAQASVDVVTQNLERGSEPTGNVRILNRWYQGTEESTIAGLTALSVVGLLMACVNVASIGLSRALTRSREIVVRLALGAPRRAIVGQLLAETLVFFLPAVPIGAVLATWFVTENPYIDLDLRPDWRVLVFTLAVVFVAAIVAGLTPALQVLSTKLTGGLNESSSGSGRKRQRLHHALIPIQVAASVALLAVGGLYYRTLHHLASNQGFDATGLHAAMLDFGISGLKSEEGRLLTRQLVPLMNALPDVESASLALGIPGTGTLYRRTGLWKPGQALVAGKPAMYAPLNIVAPGFLETMGIEVVRGRDFSDADREGTRQVALVSQGLARQLGVADTAVGRTIYSCAEAKCAAEIVGVVADSAALVRTEPVFYRPLEQQYSSDVYLVFRSTNPGAVISSTRQALKLLNPNVPILETLSVADGVRDAVFYQYIGFWSMAPLGLVTLVMAALGIYGVASYAVSSRMGEIGIRTALGARPGRVIGGLIRHPLLMAAIGLAAGCACGLLVARSIPAEPGFYGVSYFDPATYACASLVVLAIVFLAGYVPAQRAATSDPMLVLRHE
jgi:predicted permease